eukprot:7955779-Pyramimonas_sp.AAC.2
MKCTNALANEVLRRPIFRKHISRAITTKAIEDQKIKILRGGEQESIKPSSTRRQLDPNKAYTTGPAPAPPAPCPSARARPCPGARRPRTWQPPRGT